MSSRRWLIWPRSRGGRNRSEAGGTHRAVNPGRVEDHQDRASSPEQRDRRERAVFVVQAGLAQAEEKYLVDADATLAIWFARVAETIGVVSRVALQRIEEGRRIEEAQIASEQLGVLGDVCAEAIRAAARAWVGCSPVRAREEIVGVLRVAPEIPIDPSWIGILGSMAQCTAALEPLANGLREEDLPMNEPTDCTQVAHCFLEVAIVALQAVDVLC